MNETLKQAECALKLGRARSQIVRVGQTNGRDSDMTATCVCTPGRGGLSREIMASNSSSMQEKSAFPAPILSQTTQFPTFSLPLFLLLLQHDGSEPEILLVGKC